MDLFDTALKASKAEFHAEAIKWLASRIGFDGYVWGNGRLLSSGGLEITDSTLVGRPIGIVNDYPICTVTDPVSSEFLKQPGKLQNVSVHRHYEPKEVAPIRDYLDHYRVRQLQLNGTFVGTTNEYSWIVFYREETMRPFLAADEANSRDAVQLVLMAENFRKSVQEFSHVLAPARHNHAVCLQLEALTVRQREVLHYLEHGWPNKLIAHHMGITPNTLKTHMRETFRVLNVHSRFQAVLKAREMHAKTAAKVVSQQRDIVD